MKFESGLSPKLGTQFRLNSNPTITDIGKDETFTNPKKIPRIGGGNDKDYFHEPGATYGYLRS